MATTTIQLRHLLQTNNFELFDFDYDFDDQNFKIELEQAIIDEFYFHEISGYTPDRFKHMFRTKWKRIIGYYNKLYNTTLLEYNPMINYKMDEALEELSNSNNTQNNTSESTVNGTNDFNTQTTRDEDSVINRTTNEKNSDYPQQAIASSNYLKGELQREDQEDIATDHNEGSSGSSTNDDKTNTTAEVTENGTIDKNYSKTIEGITGLTYQDLIQKERSTIIRITGDIIEEMKVCFILVYG